MANLIFRLRNTILDFSFHNWTNLPSDVTSLKWYHQNYKHINYKHLLYDPQRWKRKKNSLLTWTTILKMELNPTEMFPVCAVFVVKSGELPSRAQPTLYSFYLSRSYALCCQPRKQDKRYTLFHISATRSWIQKPVKVWLDTRQCIECVLGWPCFILFSPVF